MKLLKEPLLHFTVLALLIFAAFGVLKPTTATRPASAIVVTSGKVGQMAAVFSKTWQRAPNEAELKGLIEDYIAEEALVREALALGLDENDTVIRRRLRQKMEFISDAEVDALAPTDTDLQAHLDAHASAYQIDPMISFTQIFLSPEKHGDALLPDAAALLAQLKANPERDVSVLGDPSLLPGTERATKVTRIGNDFGPEFASAIAELPVGIWSGPVASAYGLHLVRVTDRQPGRMPALTEVRDAVLRDWSNAEREKRSKEQLDSLLTQYTVTIEMPKANTP